MCSALRESIDLLLIATGSEVDIAITGQTVAFTATTLPNDTLGAPGWTIKFAVGIRNDGNGNLN